MLAMFYECFAVAQDWKLAEEMACKCDKYQLGRIMGTELCLRELLQLRTPGTPSVLT